MSSEWPNVRLGEHVDSCLGKMLDAKKNKGTPQPYLGNSNVRWGEFDLTNLSSMKFEDHEEERYSLRSGDLVVCEGGEPGRCAIWTGPDGMKIQKALHRIRPKPTISNYYLFYWFTHSAKSGTLDAYFTGTTIKHLTGKAIAALELPLPPISVQESIVALLKPLDDRITLLRETNKTLEAIAQAIFKSWFVDFDPVRAKMECRQPEGMDEETAALFPDSFEESELGLRPRGWFLGQLGTIATTLRYSIPASDLTDSMAYVGLEHLPRRELSLTEWSSAGGLESTKAAFSAGDILFGRLRPYFHKVVIAPLNGVCSTDILVCRPQKPEFHAFLALHLFSDSLVEYADRLSNGARMPRVSWKDLASYPITLPPEDIAFYFNILAQTMFDKMHANVFQVQTLESLRDTLLPRLISGQIQVHDAEEQIENALS